MGVTTEVRGMNLLKSLVGMEIVSVEKEEDEKGEDCVAISFSDGQTILVSALTEDYGDLSVLVFATN